MEKHEDSNGLENEIKGKHCEVITRKQCISSDKIYITVNFNVYLMHYLLFEES